MHILMLSWEYPPRVIGGLAHHVRELARSLVEAGHNVSVITVAENNTPVHEIVEGVAVHRVLPYHGRPLNFLSWVQQLNLAMLETGASLCRRGGVDLIHAHDWLVAYAGRGLKHIFHLPLLATIHATEFGRNNGLHNPEQRYISELEWWLTYEAWRVICCSEYMREELRSVFSLPGDKIAVIPNGVRPEVFRVKTADPEVRARFAAPHEKILLFIGRLVPEKGVEVLLNALPAIRERVPALRLVVAGRGPYREELEHQTRILGLEQHVLFAGYIDDRTRNQLYAHAAVAVFPSLYEPFGLVALEGMAAGTPVVVGASGGFLETVEHEVNGLLARPGDPADLALQIGRILSDPDLTAGLVRRAAEDIETRFAWPVVAQETGKHYRQIVASAEARRWRRELEYDGPVPAAGPVTAMVPPEIPVPAAPSSAGRPPSRYTAAEELLAKMPPAEMETGPASPREVRPE